MVVIVCESENWMPFPPKKKWIRHYLEEYPSTEKTYAPESSSPSPSSAAAPTSSMALPTKNVPPQNASVAYATADSTLHSSNSVISSTVSPVPLLTNGSSPSVAFTTLPSFSPSPSLTFTFTTSTVPSQTASLLKISQQPTVRLPSATPPRHQTSPLIIQQHNHVSYSPPPPRTLPQHTPPPTAAAPSNTVPSVAIVPQPTYVDSRTSNVSDLKRKLSNSGTREVHNKLEKNRRAHLKQCFELLKSQVPAIQDEKKPSNLTILRTAIRYVQILRRREQELASDLERLSKEKMANQQRLTTLKKELLAQWDHIDINALLPNTVEAIKPTPGNDNSPEQRRNYETDAEAEKFVMSDLDDSSSHIKSKGGTYYGSSSSTGSCSISPLHISSPNVVSTTSDGLPPQIHIVEASSVPFDKITSSNVANPLQFLSTSTIRMITDAEQPIALVQHNGGDKSAEPTTTSIPKMAVHSGNTFTIFSDSLQKVTTTGVSGVASSLSSTNTKFSTNSSLQFTHGLPAPSTSVHQKNVILPVKTGFPQAPPNGAITSASVVERNNSVLLTPVHTNVRNITNHSFVVTQPPSGPVILTTTTPNLPTNQIMPTPLLKTVSRLQPINGHHQLMMKPNTMVAVSSSTAASK